MWFIVKEEVNGKHKKPEKPLVPTEHTEENDNVEVGKLLIERLNDGGIHENKSLRLSE